MALTKEDLQAISQVVKAETDPINKRLDALQGDVVELKEGQAATQEDVTHIKEVADTYYKWVDRIDLRVKALERG